MGATSSFCAAFNYSDDHCAAQVAAGLELLPEALRGAVDGASDHEAATLLKAALAEARTAGDAALEVTLEEASHLILGHGASCLCTEMEAEAELDWVRDCLAQLKASTWALCAEGDSPAECGRLDLDELFAPLGWRDGWTSVEVSYVDPVVTAVFGDRYGSRRTVTATALSELQQRALVHWEADQWSAATPSPEPVAAVCSIEPHLLAAAVGLADQEIVLPWYDAEGPAAICDIVAELRSCGFAKLDEVTAEVAAGLAGNWEGSVEDLVQAARLALDASAVPRPAAGTPA